MQALMLAAGMGRRLGKHTEHHTKCMVSVGGKTLLMRAVEALAEAGIKKLIIVIGYGGDHLKKYIENNQFPLTIEYVCNNEFAATNNIYSLYLAKEYLTQDDTLLLESDIIFEKSILKKVVDSPEPNVVAAAKYEHWMDGTVVKLDRFLHILEFVDKQNFRYDETDLYYKTVNIYKFSKEYAKKQYIPFLNAYLQAYGTNQYYEQVLKILTHIHNSDLKALLIEDEAWYEVDDAQDLDIANTIFADDNEILRKYEYHFGGYWRFPKVRDYCYLVNPYYPPQKLVDQMQYFYQQLLTQYPSGMKIQQLNAGSMFDIDEDYLLVGNGAAELIQILGHTLPAGRMLLCIPTFNEYIRCFKHCSLTKLNLSLDGYRFNHKKILEEIEHTDYLMLINPDNPTGDFIAYDAMINILKRCKEKNVMCFIDESFIDFADKKQRYTLVKESILKEYPELIVIKSIGKSYGVPGLRLGIMASANKSLLKKMKLNMGIWNINSFAEYYLQIQRLYKKSYVLSCDKVAAQRKILQNKLSVIPYLEVFDSQANYIMCKVNGRFNSEELASILLKQYCILIKDLSKKEGFFKLSFIRIAVKNEEDNDRIVHALNEICGLEIP